ncbi:hypothetical protein FOB63_001334 [Clavispora lusitaniae]|uniref:uncharacterized protein n=1 Tax=Clavispora lusitaniae TaxID=36911 RepID=UPI00202BFEE6|nr:hypothetical protein FOB63_001334 [Clavispora lusitaniae]
MSEEPFSAEYFQHLLTSLTLNSRALIVELTGLAEKHIDHAAVMVQLIEERIARILPKYKLYSFYLLDSIVKNIGNPYNLLFAANLYKNFTDTYLIVTDTATRQNLINLFKTWLTGKTLAGQDLFPQEILAKIEKFIIKATSLNAAAPDAGAARISRDALLREANYLLQYVIALDDGVDKLAQAHSLSENNTAFVQECRRARNTMVYDINSISEAVMMESKAEFDAKKDSYALSLQKIRRTLDDQSFQQQDLVSRLTRALESKVELNLVPKHVDVLMILGVSAYDEFDTFLAQWGKIPVQTAPAEPAPAVKDSDRKTGAESETAIETETEAEAEPRSPETTASLASTFGLNMDSFNFADSLLGSPKNEIRHMRSNSYSDDSMDEDEYDPEETLNEVDGRHSPPSSAGPVFAGKSSMKRPANGEERVVKRVRFDL